MPRLHRTGLLISFLALAPLPAAAQTPANLAALAGLAPVARLLETPEGRAALEANLAVTEGIHLGTVKQPLLLSFDEQRRLALKDCFITDGNASELADGLGTSLAQAYQTKARYTTWKDFEVVGPAVTTLIGYTNSITKTDSNAGKYFFANLTRDGKAPASEEAKAILAKAGGTADVFGKAYGRLAGTAGADAYGNSRPFQTLPKLEAWRGEDFFGNASHSLDWLRGPNQPLADSPSYPSGHTTYGFTESMLLAILVPERYQQMVTRAAEYGNNRIVVGAHYTMDVIGGRATALHAIAHLLANDPAYVGQPRKNPAQIDAMGHPTGSGVVVEDFQAALREARIELQAALAAGCGASVATCAASDQGRFAVAEKNRAFYGSTQTYGLPVVHPVAAARKVDVGAVAPEAGYLLTAAFPMLSLAEANAILTETLGPGGSFLDDGSAFGLYSRFDLYAAGGKAAAMQAERLKTGSQRTER